MKVTRTITIDGKTQEEFEFIKAHLEKLKLEFPGWSIVYDLLARKATAIKVDEVDSL